MSCSSTASGLGPGNSARATNTPNHGGGSASVSHRTSLVTPMSQYRSSGGTSSISATGQGWVRVIGSGVGAWKSRSARRFLGWPISVPVPAFRRARRPRDIARRPSMEPGWVPFERPRASKFQPLAGFSHSTRSRCFGRVHAPQTPRPGRAVDRSSASRSTMIAFNGVARPHFESEFASTCRCRCRALSRRRSPDWFVAAGRGSLSNQPRSAFSERDEPLWSPRPRGVRVSCLGPDRRDVTDPV